MEELRRRKRLVEALDVLVKHNSAVDVIECIDTICIIANNVIQFPADKRFRKIKINNFEFEDRVVKCRGGIECLEAIGFTREAEDELQMDANLYAEEQCSLRVLRDLATQTMLELDSRFQDLKRVENSHKWKTVAGAGFADDIGRRNTMEDEHILIDEFAGYANLSYFGLYDGHGGREAVDFAVRALHANLEFAFRDRLSSNIPEELVSAFLLTDQQLRRRNVWDSGTTSVSCLYHKISADRRILYCANAGDSRAVLCRNGQAVRISRDHKPNDEDEARRIVASGGFVGNHNRVNGILAVSRALGDHMLKPFVSAEPTISVTNLKKSDLFMIIACDGLWDVCTDQEAVDIVIQRTLLAKKYERQKERDSAITKSVSAQSRASRRQQRSNVASINDIFGAPNANPAKAEAISNNEEFEVEESSNEIEKDKIPEKITEKMKSKAVSDLPNAARDLVDLALQRRTLDNVSVLVVWF